MGDGPLTQAEYGTLIRLLRRWEENGDPNSRERAALDIVDDGVVHDYARTFPGERPSWL